MAYVSLEGSIRTCKVHAGNADRMNSDRFLNPNLMICPAWNGVDSTGRVVCKDSFYTKRAGCNSATDRVLVENALRPQYIEYVNLNAAGIRGGQQCEGYQQVNPDTMCNAKAVEEVHGRTGQFGYVTQFGQYITPSCSSCDGYPYKNMM